MATRATRLKKRPLPTAVWVSAATAVEIAELARTVGRSVAFVVQRALAAAKLTTVEHAAPEEASLLLTVDEADPADLLARVVERAGELGAIDATIEAAWLATRGRFMAWAEQERAARCAEVADELDVALAAARSAASGTAELSVLGASVYPRVRALVAAHAATDQVTLARLALDREPYVREAVARRRA